MSSAALRTTTLAIQRLLHSAVGPRDPVTRALQGSPNDWVHVGAPISADVGTRPVSLFLFHILPNAELRNAPRLAPPGEDGSMIDPNRFDALPLDLRYLISVHRPTVSTDAIELEQLGRMMARLHTDPTLGGALLPGQEVRLTLEPYSMEELSRIWSLFPNQAYRSSVVYLASPVYIDARELLLGAPVVDRRFDIGHSAGPPDVFGDRRPGGA